MTTHNDSRVLLLHYTLKYDIDHAKADMIFLAGAMKRWSKRVMHGSRYVGVAIVTDETADQLRQRLAPVLDAMNVIDDFWIAPAPKADDVVGRLGNFSPFNHFLREAWVEAAKRSRPQNVRRLQRR